MIRSEGGIIIGFVGMHIVKQRYFHAYIIQQAVKAVKLSRPSSCQGSYAVKAVMLSRQSSCHYSQSFIAVKLS